MAVESKSGGPGHNSGWYNHLIERKTQSVVGSLCQVQAALTDLGGMSKGVARVLNASRFTHPCSHSPRFGSGCFFNNGKRLIIIINDTEKIKKNIKLY